MISDSSTTVFRVWLLRVRFNDLSVNEPYIVAGWAFFFLLLASFLDLKVYSKDMVAGLGKLRTWSL